MTGAVTPARLPRAKAVGLITALVAGLGLSVLGAPAASAQQAGDDRVLPTGAAASENMSLVANLPKSGAFADVSSFNSDMAFKGNQLYMGNYNGFTVYDIREPRRPREIVQVVCPGAQNDPSVYGNLLFLSVDSRRNDDTCSSVPATAEQSRTGDYWEGIRIFDISNPAAPRYIKSVETQCGSHTHTLVPGRDRRDVYLYISSYGPDVNIANCQPPHDKISIVKVPVVNPRAAEVVATPVLFPGGGNPGQPVTETATSAVTEFSPLPYAATAGCHDITVFIERNIAAGACMGEGVIMDISNPVAPRVVESVYDTENFSFWHSATFSNDADKVVFTDELGGGGAPTCNERVGPNRGADAIYTLSRDRQLTLRSYFKIPRMQADTENCVAHNGSLIPVTTGRDIMVQAWYQGGVSVFDFTNPRSPRELAWFDRGAISDERLVVGGAWSAYYYNGHVFVSEIQRGLDVLQVDTRETESAEEYRFGRIFNPQTQEEFPTFRPF